MAYIKANEAITLLGLPESTFHRWVKEGKIKKYFLTNESKHGVYSPDEIMKLRQNMHEEDKEEISMTDWLTPDDLGSLYDLEYKRYGDETGDPSLIRGWVKRNPFIGKILFNAADRRDLWGAINLIPLQEDTIFRLLKREIRDVDLDPEKDILTYDAPGTYNVYAASVILRSDKREHFIALLDSIFTFWVDMAPARQLGRIYGRAVSEDGQMLAARLFFSPLDYISDDVYRLDLNKKSFSKYIQRIQKKIQDKNK